MEASMLAKLSRERWVVSNRDAEVRRGRSARKVTESLLAEPEADRGELPHSGARPVVAVTGAARGLGHALTSRLASSPRVGRVIAIDDHRGETTGVTWRVVDVRDPALAGRLAGVDVVVHTDLDLAPDSDAKARRAFNVRGAQTVLTAAAAGGVGRVVLVTSAMVYGARPDNPVPLPEDAPLGADQDGSVVGDLLEIEQLAERSARAHLGMAVTVVRPAALVGEGIDTLITRHFEAPRLLAVKGCAPRWQFCHIDDLVSALELAAAGEVTGAFAVGCDGWLEPEQLEELSGLKRIELPAGLTFATAQRLHRAGITPAPVNDLHFVVYPWVVDCAALRAAGWRPSYDNAAAVAVLLDQRAGHHAVAGRRLAKKDATITAAGATVAVIGTAAIVRHARRRRRGS
jgi:nucleoside-diphosphate-sugar epimerase